MFCLYLFKVTITVLPHIEDKLRYLHIRQMSISILLNPNSIVCVLCVCDVVYFGVKCNKYFAKPSYMYILFKCNNY